MTNRIVSDAAVEEALDELAKLDDKEAELRAAKEWGERREKIIFSEQLAKQTSGTVADKEAMARLSPEYTKHVEDMRTVTINHTKAKNRRETLMATLDIWRTEQASMRQRT
jgi:hypothetical protein